MNKKLIIIIAAVVVAVGGFFMWRNSGLGGDSNGDGVITIWCWDPNFNVPIIQDAADNYAAANPDAPEIEVVPMNREDIEQKMDMAFSTGEISAMPDILLMTDNKAKRFLSNYPDAFVPLEDEIDYSEFYSYKVEDVSYDGHTYGVPFDTGSTGIYYRADVAAEAGYTEEDFQDLTWDEYIAIGEDIYNQTGVKWFTYWQGDPEQVNIMLQSAGVSKFNENGEFSPSNPEAFTLAMETYAQIINSPATTTVNDWDTYVSGFCDGSLGATVDASWMVGTITSCVDSAGDWAIAPTPKLDVEGSVNASNSGGSSWYVVNGTGDEEAAIDFLTYTFTGEQSLEFYDYILLEYGAMGSYIPATTSDAYKTEVDFFGGQQIYADFAAWAQEIQPIQYGPNNSASNTAMGNVLPQVASGEVTGDEIIPAVKAEYDVLAGE